MINRTLARLRLCRIKMRREGALLLQGKRKFTPSTHTNIELTFARIRAQLKPPAPNVRVIAKRKSA